MGDGEVYGAGETLGPSSEWDIRGSQVRRRPRSEGYLTLVLLAGLSQCVAQSFLQGVVPQGVVVPWATQEVVPVGVNRARATGADAINGIGTEEDG